MEAQEVRQAPIGGSSVNHILDETVRIRALPILTGHDLLRIYFYDAPPAKGTLRNPINGSILDLSISDDRRPNFQLSLSTVAGTPPGTPTSTLTRADSLFVSVM